MSFFVTYINFGQLCHTVHVALVHIKSCYWCHDYNCLLNPCIFATTVCTCKYCLCHHMRYSYEHVTRSEIKNVNTPIRIIMILILQCSLLANYNQLTWLSLTCMVAVHIYFHFCFKVWKSGPNTFFLDMNNSWTEVEAHRYFYIIYYTASEQILLHF